MTMEITMVLLIASVLLLLFGDTYRSSFCIFFSVFELPAELAITSIVVGVRELLFGTR